MTIQFPTETETSQHLGASRRRLMTRIHRRRTGVRLAAGGGAVLLAGSGIAASIVVQQESAYVIQNSVTCYAHDDLNSFSGSAAQAEATTSDGTAVSQAPMDREGVCALVWRSGVGAAANGERWDPNIDPNTSTLAVPKFAFCTLANGTAGGFPIEAPATTARDVCSRLGLLPFLS